MWNYGMSRDVTRCHGTSHDLMGCHGSSVSKCHTMSRDVSNVTERLKFHEMFCEVLGCHKMSQNTWISRGCHRILWAHWMSYDVTGRHRISRPFCRGKPAYKLSYCPNVSWKLQKSQPTVYDSPSSKTDQVVSITRAKWRKRERNLEHMKNGMLHCASAGFDNLYSSAAGWSSSAYDWNVPTSPLGGYSKATGNPREQIVSHSSLHMINVWTS
jgi:hypothetical protein